METFGRSTRNFSLDKMKKQLLLLVTLFSVSSLIGQSPVTWKFSHVAEADSGLVTLTASIEEGWHLYGLVLENDLGPLPTVITFNEEVVQWGALHAPKTIQKYDDMFLMNVNYYESNVTFTRKFKGDFKEITGSVEYMVCNDEMCLPPVTVDFELLPVEDQ